MVERQNIIQRGRVIVSKTAIQAVSYEEPFDYKEKFGLDSGVASGTIYLHLFGGGRINVSSDDPAVEAREWAEIAGLL